MRHGGKGLPVNGLRPGGNGQKFAELSQHIRLLNAQRHVRKNGSKKICRHKMCTDESSVPSLKKEQQKIRGKSEASLRLASTLTG
jgi:hypothetical protein